MPSPAPPRLDHLDLKGLQGQWTQLHPSDTEVWPQDLAMQQAWLALHRGQFDEAVALALAAGPIAFNVANQAQCILARHRHMSDKERMAVLGAVADRAAGQLTQLFDPPEALARAHYWRGHALAQYCQGMPVAKALALGMSLQARTHLELACALAPQHAQAHLALARFHAELIDQVGPLIAQISFGANVQTAERLMDRAGALQTRSILGLVEQARIVLKLHGEASRPQARRLWEQAVGLRALDAAEQLEIALAQAELQD